MADVLEAAVTGGCSASERGANSGQHAGAASAGAYYLPVPPSPPGQLLQARDHRALSGAPALRGELGEVQLGFVPVCEPDNHGGMPAYGFQVGVES